MRFCRGLLLNAALTPHVMVRHRKFVLLAKQNNRSDREANGFKMG
jgi:hypothetical protein